MSWDNNDYSQEKNFRSMKNKKDSLDMDVIMEEERSFKDRIS